MSEGAHYSGPNSHFRLWQFSDCHLQADVAGQLYGVNCDASLQRVLSTAMSSADRADVCLLTGDLVQDKTEAGYRRLQGHLEGLAMPAYCLPGNHDSVDLMHEILVTNAVSCVGHFIHRQWLVVLLDTTVADSNAGYLSASECLRLASLLRQHSDLHVLVAMHHPPLPTAMQWLDTDVTLTNPERIHALVADHSPRIRAVIWGHAHQELLRMRDDVLWAGCPSTMAQFRPGVDVFTLDDKPAGFRWLDLWDDGRVSSGIMRVV